MKKEGQDDLQNEIFNFKIDISDSKIDFFKLPNFMLRSYPIRE